MRALVGLLDAACRGAPAAIALADERKTITYAAFDRGANEIARELAACAIEPDEPVLVMVSNRPCDLVEFLGVWCAGGVAVPLQRSSTTIVVESYVQATGARIVVDAAGEAQVPAAFVRRGNLFRSDRAAPVARPILADAALIVFTSGSTGKPKGAVLSHRAIAGKLAANDSFLNFAANERTLLVLNITFSFGIWVSLLTLAKGGTLVMRDRFRASSFLQCLLDERIERVAVVPTMMRALMLALNEPEQHQRLMALRESASLRQIMIGGEFLAAALGEAIVEQFPRAALVDIYGLTETATSDFVLHSAQRARYGGCIGRPAPNVSFRIAPTEASGDAGELQIRTPYIMNGYLDAPELTAAAFSEGYFRTGDLARIRDDDVVEIVGRAKEIISRAGTKIAPLELERTFAEHPAVAEVLAAGAPDPVLGERVHVLIVRAAGVAVNVEGLRQFAAARLERFKWPDYFYFADALPLGRTGKADRGVLRTMIESGELSPTTE